MIPLKKERASTRKRKAPIRFASFLQPTSKSENSEEPTNQSETESPITENNKNTPNKKTCIIKETYEKILREHRKQVRIEAKKQWSLAQENKAKSTKTQPPPKSYIPVKEIKPLVGQNMASVTIFKPINGRLTQTDKIEKSLITLPEIQPLPRYTDWTLIPYNIRENESKYLTNIPYLGDELIDRDSNYLQDVLGLYDWKVEEDTLNKRLDDEVFFSLITELIQLQNKYGEIVFTPEFNIQTLQDEKCENSSGHKNNIELLPSEMLVTELRKVLPIVGSDQEVAERYKLLKANREFGTLPLLPSRMEQYHPSCYPVPNIDNVTCAQVLPPQKTMSAFRSLFCQRCYQYDCQRHSDEDNVPPRYKKKKIDSPQTSNLSVGTFKCADETSCYRHLKTEELETNDCSDDWTAGEISLFRCLIESFQNYCFISKIMISKSCVQVFRYATKNDASLHPQSSDNGTNTQNGDQSLDKRKSRRSKKSGETLNKRKLTKRWINNAKKMEKLKCEIPSTSSQTAVPNEMKGAYFSGHHFKDDRSLLPNKFKPCVHTNGIEECDNECSCRQKNTSCEKYCTCSIKCTNRFPGCCCTGTCDTKRCICFAAARECDPDLCKRCGASEIDTSQIKCQNVNIQRHMEKHLLIGTSDVSGWGIFIKDDLQKGDFIAEYRGEILNPEESDKRGYVYDRLQHTYLFGLNKEHDIDAMRKGNKARFINSSKTPNCEIRRMLVNGDHRIGIYAKRNIDAGEELSYDYESTREKQRLIAARHASNMASQ